MANLGYIGLGAMGGRMADRLLAKGHTVTGYNRTKSKAQGCSTRACSGRDSPRAVAAGADVTFVMVTDTTALNAVVDGPDGLLAGLGPASCSIDMSTVSPAASRALAEQVRARGAEMLDCPGLGQRLDARGRASCR